MNCVCKYTLVTCGQLEFSATWHLYSKHPLNPFLAAYPFCPIPSGRRRVNKLGGFCLQLCHGVSGALSYCSKALHPAFQPCFCSRRFSFCSQWMFVFLTLEYSGYVKCTSMEDATKEQLSKLQKRVAVFQTRAH